LGEAENSTIVAGRVSMGRFGPSQTKFARYREFLAEDKKDRELHPHTSMDYVP